MAYIKRFEEIYKKMEDPKKIIAYTTNKNETTVPGTLFTSIKGGTETELKLKNPMTAQMKMKRPDVLFLIDKSPDKNNLKTWDDDPREAQFKLTDFVMKSKNCVEGLERLYKELYKHRDELFAKNMTKLGYEALEIKKDNAVFYIVFDKNCIKEV